MVVVNLCAASAPGWWKFMVFIFSGAIVALGFVVGCNIIGANIYICMCWYPLAYSMLLNFDVNNIQPFMHSRFRSLYYTSHANIKCPCKHKTLSLALALSFALCLCRAPTSTRHVPAESSTTQVLYFRGPIQATSANQSMCMHFDCDLWFPGDIYPEPFHSVSVIASHCLTCANKHEIQLCPASRKCQRNDQFFIW